MTRRNRRGSHHFRRSFWNRGAGRRGDRDFFELTLTDAQHDVTDRLVTKQTATLSAWVGYPVAVHVGEYF